MRFLFRLIPVLLQKPDLTPLNSHPDWALYNEKIGPNLGGEAYGWDAWKVPDKELPMLVDLLGEWYGIQLWNDQTAGKQ